MRTQGLGEDDRGWGKKDVQDNSSLKHEKGMRDGGGEYETKGKRERLEIQREGLRERERKRKRQWREREEERDRNPNTFSRETICTAVPRLVTPQEFIAI